LHELPHFHAQEILRRDERPAEAETLEVTKVRCVCGCKSRCCCVTHARTLNVPGAAHHAQVECDPMAIESLAGADDVQVHMSHFEVSRCWLCDELRASP
jgi:hypothetical protein